jgi:hypothetical protein
VKEVLAYLFEHVPGAGLTVVVALGPSFCKHVLGPWGKALVEGLCSMRVAHIEARAAVRVARIAKPLQRRRRRLAERRTPKQLTTGGAATRTKARAGGSVRDPDTS